MKRITHSFFFASLHLAQLRERLGDAAVNNIEY